MKFYAYIPDKNNFEPTGSANRILFELKTFAGAIRRAKRILGNNIHVFKYTDIYDDKTFLKIF